VPDWKALATFREDRPGKVIDELLQQGDGLSFFECEGIYILEFR